uniref:Uncharacterized protein n=1 Tax=viral metagenome TaxID=1070528 RepID=A0A6C0AD25_9ZZZZ
MNDISSKLEKLTINIKVIPESRPEDLKNYPILKIDLTNEKIIEEYKNKKDVIYKHPEFTKWNKEQLRHCLNYKGQSTASFGWIYKAEFTNMNDFLSDKKQIILLKDKYPELVKEIDFNHEINKNLNLKTLTYGSGKEIAWKCLKDSSHPIFIKSCASRFCKSRPLSNCIECHYDSIRILDKKEKENHIKNYAPDISNITLGDETEEFLVDLLKKSAKFLNIEKTGQTSEKCDIKVILKNGKEKSLQVKTLSKISNGYSLRVDFKYEKDMLIAMVSQDRLCFVLEFYGNLKLTGYEFKADSKYKHSHMIINNEHDFCKILSNKIEQSSNYKQIISKTHFKEVKMFKRLKKFCDKNNFSFERNSTNGNTIDLFINNIPMQAKYTSLNMNKDEKRNTYKITMSKSCGKLKGINVNRPYNQDDKFEYIVVEIGGTEKNKKMYHKNFCFIPKEQLIINKIFSGYLDENNEISKGKKSMYICPPDYKSEHWSKQYWNNISFLK